MAKKERGNGNKSVNEVLDNAKQKQNAEAAEEDVTAEIAEMPEIMDVKDFRLIDEHVTASIMDAMTGVYQQEVVYNIPKRSSTGKTSWPACKRMPGGKCSFEGQRHMHILGISYPGALIAASVYGGLDYGVRGMPQLIEFGDKPFWVVEVFCNDRVRRNSYNRWQFEPAMKSSKGGGYYWDEYACMSVQSKGVRNMILACIPQRVQEVWKGDYIAGRNPFDPQVVLEAGYRRQPEALPPKTEPDQPKDKPKEEKPKEEKPKPKTQGVQDLEEVCKQLAQKIGQPAEKILKWTAVEYDSPGKAMSSMVNAMENPAALKTVRDLVAAYTPVENGAEAEGGAGASAEQEEMKL